LVPYYIPISTTSFRGGKKEDMKKKICKLLPVGR
jgi:hypothetical protein